MKNRIIPLLPSFFTTLLLLIFSACQNQYGVRENASQDLYVEELALDLEYAPPGIKKKVPKSDEANPDDAIPHNTEEYNVLRENDFMNAQQNPLSTFSIDVDNASYSNIRRFLEYELPPVDAVRIEEMINYFSYDYPQPRGEHPFSLITEVAEVPWNRDHHLVHIGIQGKSLDYEELRASNLVFLVDCSGSMEAANKLPLLKKSLGILLDQLGPEDRVAIVAYAGAAGLVLPSTPATEKSTILNALNQLKAGGSTAGGQGIELAYKIAKEQLIEEGNNRVVLATDGDFNVGVSSSAALVRLIEEKRKDDIYLTICGLGMGNYKDGRMEEISNAGNGNYFYIDNIREAEKVFGREMRANMFTIAKDVKIQIEFNPARVKAYRLIGYVNRKLANEDFDNDLVDAGELGAGHTVTALYEIIPAGSEETVRQSADLKYQTTELSSAGLNSKDMMTLKLRYKPIHSEQSILLEKVVPDDVNSLQATSENFRFSAAVAGFGLLLRQSKYKGQASYDQIIDIAKSAIGPDLNGDRAEFIQLVKQAQLLDDRMEASRD